MKKPWLALLLSVLCAGAGLVYLGRVGWGVLNFFAVVLLGIALVAVLPGDWIQAAGIGLCAASGSLAMGVAQSMNARLRIQGTAPAAGPAGLPPGPAVVPAPRSIQTRFCSECGARIDDAKFCPDCGQRQRPRDECAGCGAKLHAGSRFCAECGVQVV
jgi:membrane protease subunit (stomatin/prohibitin family)